MQGSLKIKLSNEFVAALQQNNDLKYELLTQTIHNHSDQISYMLQAYYSREKVSHVMVVDGTLHFDGQMDVKLKLEYTMEEFNACSAVDTLNKQKMTVGIDFDLNAAELSLTGEYWAERDLD